MHHHSNGWYWSGQDWPKTTSQRSISLFADQQKSWWPAWSIFIHKHQYFFTFSITLQPQYYKGLVYKLSFLHMMQISSLNKWICHEYRFVSWIKKYHIFCQFGCLSTELKICHSQLIPFITTKLKIYSNLVHDFWVCYMTYLLNEVNLFLSSYSSFAVGINTFKIWIWILINRELYPLFIDVWKFLWSQIKHKLFLFFFHINHQKHFPWQLPTMVNSVESQFLFSNKKYHKATKLKEMQIMLCLKLLIPLLN